MNFETKNVALTNRKLFTANHLRYLLHAIKKEARIKKADYGKSYTANHVYKIRFKYV